VSVDVEVDGIVHEIDLLYADERLIVELDGEAVHRTRRRFHTDRRRDAAFAARGYQTVRYTWDRITTEQARVADEVLRVLALRPAR
jgi:very-short-patch-repair endonuclease